MIYIMAPIQAPVTTIVLPNPLPQDRESNLLTVTARRSMNNTLYTYIKDTGRLQLTYKMELFRGKALELRAFVQEYQMSDLRLIDYRDRNYAVVLTGDPFEFTPIARDNVTQITLTFEGVLL